MKELAEKIVMVRDASKHHTAARDLWELFTLTLSEGDEEDVQDSLEDVFRWADPAILDEHTEEEEDES